MNFIVFLKWNSNIQYSTYLTASAVVKYIHSYITDTIKPLHLPAHAVVTYIVWVNYAVFR